MERKFKMGLHFRKKASESFWRPVNEMAGVIIDNIHNGDIDLEDVLDDLATHVDKKIFGERLSHPIFYKALIKKIKIEFCVEGV